VGDVPLLFTPAFTNFADTNGNALPIDRVGGVVTVTEPPAPKVTGVFVRGSAWSQAFVNPLGSGGLGYALPSGEGQLANLPWINADQIIVKFNEHVSVQQNDLLVQGVNNASYVTSAFAYDPATFTATWTLAQPLPADKVRIQLSAGGVDPIRNAAGVRLDGDWSDGTSAYPSGNGRSGGDFSFRFDVLPGNGDQTGPVNIFDTIKTRNRQFTSAGDANYSPLYDINGSGDINIFDTVQVRNRQFTALPDGEPVLAAPLASKESDETVTAAASPVRLITDNVTIVSAPGQPIEGTFDVYVEVPSDTNVSVAGYDVALTTPPGSGVTLVSAAASSATHPALYASAPTSFQAPGMLGVTDALASGAAKLDHNDGLFSVRFTAAAGTLGAIPLAFKPTFTNLADAQGNAIPIELVPGTITIAPPPTTINGTNSHDTIYVVRSGSNLQIYVNTPPTGQPTYQGPIAAFGPSLTINTRFGDDTLIVDTGDSADLGLERLVFDAGQSANTLIVKNGHARIETVAVNGTINTIVETGARLSTQRFSRGDVTLQNGSQATLLSGGATSVLTGLSLAAGATFDVGTGAVVIDYTGASPLAAVRQQIISSRGGAGVGQGAWNGTGITSSAAALANQTAPESQAIGFADNASLPLGPYSTFRGVPVDDTSILIAYTRTGDANLDGLVNDDDATILGATYAPAATDATWALGDFDYNGRVDDDDATLLGAFYQPSSLAAASEALEDDAVKPVSEIAVITSKCDLQPLTKRPEVIDQIWEQW
jgi:hypothetical protein